VPVPAFTVAGGQGTRLGYDGPKGTFPVTPLKKKTLFQVFAEKIRAAGARYGKPLHWFIMTSHANHAATESFFKDNQFFGLDASRVHFFRQGRMGHNCRWTNRPFLGTLSFSRFCYMGNNAGKG